VTADLEDEQTAIRADRVTGDFTGETKWVELWGAKGVPASVAREGRALTEGRGRASCRGELREEVRAVSDEVRGAADGGTRGSR
jgi:hypothetical protein